MNQTIEKYYRKFREHTPFMLVGSNAQQAIEAARTLAMFTALEDDGQVRLRLEHEQENYFDVYGKPDSDTEYKRTCNTLDRLGCYWIVAEYQDHSGRWQHADSIGMCVYENPLSPLENGYVIGLMSAAIACLEADSVVI